MIRRGEVHGERKPLLEDRVIVELGAIVKRERLELAAMATDSACRRARHFIFTTRAQLFDDRVTGFALDQGEHAMAHITAHDGIAFPVADLFAPLHCQRSLGDRALAGQYAPRIDAAVALAPKLAHDPSMAPQITAAALVPAD